MFGAFKSDNLFSFRLHQIADKMVLDQDGEYRIDEIVNKFIPGVPRTQINGRSSHTDKFSSKVD